MDIEKQAFEGWDEGFGLSLIFLGSGSVKAVDLRVPLVSLRALPWKAVIFWPTLRFH
jgi:hypothetical protein